MSRETVSAHASAPKRKPGRPPTYIFNKPDAELSENERRLKGSVIKRRLRQNRSYHRKKRLKELAAQASAEHTHQPHVANLVPNHIPVAPPAPAPAPNLPFLPGLEPTSAPAFPAQPPVHHIPANAPPTVPSIPLLLPQPPAVDLTAHPSRPLRPVPQPPQYAPVQQRPFRAPVQPRPFRGPAQAAAAYDDGTAVSVTSLDVTSAERPPRAFSDHMRTGVQDTGLFPLSLPSPEPARPANSPPPPEDREEERLLEEILDVSAQISVNESARMVRHAGSRAFLGNDMMSRLSSLPRPVADGIKHLLLFPGSFSAQSALHVMGLKHQQVVTLPADVLQPLMDANLVRPLPSGRYELNEITKSVLVPDSFSAANAARERFVDHFSDTLKGLDPHSLSLKGEERLKAMKVYDAERTNMRAALQMCRDLGGSKLVLWFLTHGATVMRYSTSPHERTEIFGAALSEMEASSDRASADVAAEARIRLALGEAYFDLLSFEQAKDHLQRAIGIMAGANESNSLSVSTSVLALLLLAELRISDRDFEEAKKLLIQALRSLKDADMQKSTFAVCCLLSLASVYSSLGDSEKALHTVNTSLEVLADLGFSHMPIYADALRTLGTVHLGAGNSKQAQDMLFAALNIIQKWMSRADWERAPFQHCTHLDIFLVEAIAKTYFAQQRPQEAEDLLNRARQQRRERRLDSGSLIAAGDRNPDSNNARMYTRHLY